jgi:serine/threonine-protein phosphatase 2A regulatory subunit A
MLLRYLYFQTFYKFFQVLSTVVNQEIISSTMLPLVIRLAQDRVPNIRFNVAKTLHALVPLLDTNVVQTRVKPTLSKLFDDTDRDVKFFAGQALQQC